MRKLVAFFVDNPLIVNVIIVTLMIMGFIVGSNLKKESYPDVKYNIYRILTTSEGASLRDTELLITKEIEDQLKTVSGIEKFQSSSTAGNSRINVWLNVWGVDQYDTVQEIREAISVASREFPEDTDPTIIRAIKENDEPVIRYQVRSSTLSPIEMHDLLKNFQQTLEGVMGVAEVNLSGFREREIQIQFNNQKFLHQNISLIDLKSAISNYIVRESAGSLNGPGINRSINLLTEFEKAKDISDINIRRNFASNGVSVKDIATVIDGLEDQNLFVRGNLDPGITVSIYKEDSQDNFKVLDRINQVVDEFRRIVEYRYNRVPQDKMKLIKALEESPLTIGSGDFLTRSIMDAYGYNVSIQSFKDATQETRNLLKITASNAYIGFILVFFTLWIFLDLRIAFWTSFSIPLVIILTAIVVFFIGLSINNMMLLGVITVLGLLVDDSIIVAENIYRLRSLGYKPREAAIEGVMQLAMPLVGTMLTTVCAFLPLLLVKKIDFMYISQIPLIIIITLCMSLIEIFLALPTHIAHGKDHLGQVKLRPGDRAIIWFKAKYTQVLFKATTWRYGILLLFIGLIFSAILLIPKVKFVYYSNEENDEVRIRMKAQPGTNLEDMNEKVAAVEQVILKEIGDIGNPIVAMLTTVGSGSLTPTDSNINNANQATIRLYLNSFSERKLTSSDIVKKLERVLKQKSDFSSWLDYPYIAADPVVANFLLHPRYSQFLRVYESFQEFKKPMSQVKTGYDSWYRDYQKRSLQVTNTNPYTVYRDEVKDFMRMKSGFTMLNITEPRFGPSQNNPIELVVTGNNDEMRDKALQEVYNFLAGINGIFGIEETRNEQGQDFYLNLDVRKMEQLGISANYVAQSVRTGFLGSTVGTIATADESIKITAILPRNARGNIVNLENIPIPTSYNTVIPLKNIARIELHQDVSMVIRENGKRASKLTADIDLKEMDIRQVRILLDRYIPEILVKYPGVGILKQGELGDMEETERDAMLIGMIGLTGIFFILLFIFKSLSQPIFVLSVLPFGAIGVVYAFLIHDQAMSFFGIIGIIGLTGVIINSSIVMVDYINVLMLQEGDKKTFKEIVCIGSAERIRAVILTTFTTVAGLIPSVYGWGGSLSVLKPLAMTLAYGLLFGTLITLFLIPCLYMINHDIQNAVKWCKIFILSLFKKKDS